MKTKLNYVLLALLMSIVAIPAFANVNDIYYVNINGIYYHLSGSNAEVTDKGYGSANYTGDMVIPESVTYNSTNYNVTSIRSGAFHDCSNLLSITIPQSITSIALSAFDGCSSLTSITIPRNVTTIIRNDLDIPFAGCIGLTSIIVESGNAKYDSRENCNAIIETETNTLIAGCSNTTIPNSVTTIGSCALSCSGLTSVSFPNSVTTINEGAFSACSGLTTINIPNNVITIVNNPFWGCDGLTSITVQAGNPVYDSRDGCNAIIESETKTLLVGCQNTQIPNSVTSIGSYAFSGCSGLTSVTIPNSVTNIGTDAFRYCTGLTSVTSQIETPFAFGPNAFDNIANNCVLTVPHGTKDAYIANGWTTSVFKGGIVEADAPASTNITFADANVKALCVANWDTDSDGELSYDEAAAVTSLGSVFEQNTTITSFDELQYFTGLTAISDGAFFNCTGLISITIPDNVTSIGISAFEGCSSLTSITIPDNVTSIGGTAFTGCSSLTSITIPDNVTSIGGSAFMGCIGLEEIIVEQGNTVYDSRNDCDAIIVTATNTLLFGCKNSIIPNDVTSIAAGAFRDCSTLTSITIPSSVTSIDDDAFYGCSGLETITVEQGNTVYDSRNNCNAIIVTATNMVLRGCKNTVIPHNVAHIGWYAFDECTGLTSIIIPNNVTTIGFCAFQGCENLASVTIPSSVTYIGDYAFNVCSSLTSVTIPNSVTSIGSYAFARCSGLISVVSQIETPFAFGNYTFYNIANNCVLTVPHGTKDAYIANGWTTSVFGGGIVEADAPASTNITIGSLGVGTYCSEYDLDFSGVSGIKAYVACGFKPSTGTVFIMHVDEVPANTGIMVKGTPGTYTIPVKETDMYYMNMFKGTLVSMTIPATEDGYKNYVLRNGDNGVLFYESHGSSTLGANKAYLQIPLSAAPAREFVELVEDNITGIVGIEGSIREGNEEFYNLNGQRVTTPKRGLYIRNGKKTIIR